ncbi:hypothetical protein [Tomitella biformata]|uniref:hypothetical protein n=1 Tax=Tomitella biformata TaxID=630403 RepID=UPI000463C229|nr:hypothetical protein [Tomitella biformata]
MIRKTLVAAAAVAAAAVVFAPVANADDNPRTDVTDQFIAFNEPGAFAENGDLNLLFSTYGTTGKIECFVDGAVYSSCVQIDNGGGQHTVHYVTNAGPRTIWVTADGWQPPAIPPLPALPEFHLPPMGAIVIPSMPDLGSAGAGSSPGLDINVDLAGSLGGLGLGVGLGAS